MSISSLLGLNASELSIGQMCLRAFVVYIVALLMVRTVGSRRFAGKYAAVDIILSIMLGATLSRGINGSAAFGPTLAAGLTLVGLHWSMAALAFRLPLLESWVKGRPRTLIQAGQVNHGALKTAVLTDQDLKMSLRMDGSPTDLDKIALAILEPSGSISIKPQSSEQQSSEQQSPEQEPPQVINISVEDNVQTVRVLIHRK
ncbi:MAG: YetF domain-containing protein [Phormidesmis sp.]